MDPVSKKPHHHPAWREPTAPAAISLVCLAVSFTVLSAWTFDLPIIREVIPGRPAMQVTTAISFMLTGLLIYFVGRFNGHGNRARFALSFGLLLIMGWTFLGFVFGFSPHLDELLGGGTLAPGRPSFPSAVCFLAIGLWGVGRDTRYAISDQIVGVLLLAISLPAIMGHAIGQPALYYRSESGVGVGIGMAFNTAVLFALVGYAIHGKARKNPVSVTGVIIAIISTAIVMVGAAKRAGVGGPVRLLDTVPAKGH